MNGIYGYDGQNPQGQMQSGVYTSYPGGMVSSDYPNPMQTPAPSQNRNPFAPQQAHYNLRGRYIQSPDDIQAGEVPMDGSVSFFPTSDNSAIIGKMWDKNGKLQQVRYIPDTVVEEQLKAFQANQSATITTTLNTILDKISKIESSLNS